MRGELLRVASTLIAGSGDAALLTIRDVARAAGVTPPSVYRHFEDKADLLRAVVEDRFRAFDNALAVTSVAGQAPTDVLRERCEAYLRFAEEEPGSYRVLFSAATLGPEPIGVTDRPHPGASSFFALVDSVQACIDSGSQTPGPATFTAILLWSTLHGFADLRAGKPEMPWPPAHEVVTAVLVQLGLA